MNRQGNQHLTETLPGVGLGIPHWGSFTIFFIYLFIYLFLSPADTLTASVEILAAPGVQENSGSGIGAEVVPGSGVSLRSSSNSESE